MTLLPAKDIIIAAEHGFELHTTREFRDDLEDVLGQARDDHDIDTHRNALSALARFELMMQLVPTAKYVIWHRNDGLLTLSASLESLRKEFRWLVTQ